MIFVVKTLWLMLSGIVYLTLLYKRTKGGRKHSLALAWTAVNLFASAYLLFDHLLILFKGFLEFTDMGQRIIAALFWLSLSYAIDVVIKRFLYPKNQIWEGESDVPRLVQHLVTLLIYMAAAMIIMRFIYNQPFTTLAATSGAVALALGYSARSILDETFSGLALNISAPFEKGDLIQVNDEWGYVKDITWRSISYLDMDQNIVVVPNTVVAKSRILNLDRPSKMCRRTFEFRVEYNVPPNQVIAEAEAAMKECPHVMDHPWNFVGFRGFDEKGMKYKSHFHISHYDHWYYGIDELVNVMWYRFARKGIRFAHQRHLNFTSEADEKRALPDSAYNDETWRDLLKRFKQVPMFEGMTKDDMEELAKSAILHIVGPPERIIRADSKRASMFMIASGQADVYEVDERGNETLMGSAGKSETLGLMTLLTGMPQRTTIRAREETAVWEISSESLHQLFDRKPNVMNSIAKSVTQWQAEEDEAINVLAMSRQQEARLIRDRSGFLADKINKFFKLSKADESVVDFKNN